MKHLSTASLAAIIVALATSCSSIKSACNWFLWGDAGEATQESIMAQEFKLHRNYSSHMVLQQGRPIPVSGTATPGKRVVVKLGGRQQEATADDNGEWLTVFPAMRGGNEALALTVSGDAATRPITLHDVLIGEVWFCGGQSNMEMPLWTDSPAWRNIDGDKICASGMSTPTIRIFNAASTKYPSSFSLQAEPKGSWMLPTESNLKNFSAVAYFFGLALSRRLNVPIGLIESCWSGTRIQPWISEEAYREGGDDFTRYVRQLNDMHSNGGADGELRTPIAKWYKDFMAQAEDSHADAISWAMPGYSPKTSGWSSQTQTKGELITGQTTSGTGFFWFVTHIYIPKEWAEQPAKLNFSFFNDCDETYFNGVKVGQTDFLNTYKPQGQRRIYQIPAELMKAGKATLAVRVACISDNGGICRDRLIECNGKTMRFDNEWYSRIEKLVKVVDMPPQSSENDTPNTRQFPSALFNSMVNPWTRFPVRGVIWYQGESNAGEIGHYRELFKLMARDWRSHWAPSYLSKKELANAPDMPFIYCQLSGYEPGKSWPYFRQMQQEMLQDDNLFGMAVTMDYGDANDIHPHNKRPVGERLAAEAMRLCYGSKSMSSGPVPSKCTPHDDKLEVEFSNIGLGLISIDGKALGGFEVAGANGKFFPAEAKIEGKCVILQSDKVARPIQARYAWRPYCDTMNLGNRDGFPAGPFDTVILQQENK